MDTLKTINKVFQPVLGDYWLSNMESEELSLFLFYMTSLEQSRQLGEDMLDSLKSRGSAFLNTTKDWKRFHIRQSEVTLKKAEADGSIKASDAFPCGAPAPVYCWEYPLTDEVPVAFYRNPTLGGDCLLVKNADYVHKDGKLVFFSDIFTSGFTKAPVITAEGTAESAIMLWGRFPEETSSLLSGSYGVPFGVYNVSTEKQRQALDAIARVYAEGGSVNNIKRLSALISGNGVAAVDQTVKSVAAEGDINVVETTEKIYTSRLTPAFGPGDVVKQGTFVFEGTTWGNTLSLADSIPYILISKTELGPLFGGNLYFVNLRVPLSFTTYNAVTIPVFTLYGREQDSLLFRYNMGKEAFDRGLDIESVMGKLGFITSINPYRLISGSPSGMSRCILNVQDIDRGACPEECAQALKNTLPAGVSLGIQWQAGALSETVGADSISENVTLFIGVQLAESNPTPADNINSKGIVL